MKLYDLLNERFETIVTATEKNGEINREKSNEIVDPRGYFSKNKRNLKKKKIIKI